MVKVFKIWCSVLAEMDSEQAGPSGRQQRKRPLQQSKKSALTESELERLLYESDSDDMNDPFSTLSGDSDDEVLFGDESLDEDDEEFSVTEGPNLSIDENPSSEIEDNPPTSQTDSEFTWVTGPPQIKDIPFTKETKLLVLPNGKEN